MKCIAMEFRSMFILCSRPGITPLAWFVMLLTSACSVTGEQEPIVYWRYQYMDESVGPRIDTVEHLPFHDPKDSLLGYSAFYWKGTRHLMSGFTSDLHRPIDGGSFAIELDSLGVIYSHSTTWPSFMFVRSSNDSISELMTAAIAAAHRPGHLGLHYHPIGPEPPVMATDEFIEGDTSSKPNQGKSP